MNQPIRLLCYIGSLHAGGAERQVVELLRHLDRRRFQPHLLLAHRQGELLRDVPDDVPVLCATPERPLLSQGLRWWRSREFARILEERKIELVYDRTYLATLDAAVACRLRPTPRISAAVADPRVQFDLYAKRPRFLWRSFSRWAYRSADLVLANSHGLQRQLVEFWKLPADRVVVQPNAFDFARIDQLATAEIPPEHRQPPGYHPLTVGRIDMDKDHETLVRALRILVHERGMRDVFWTILGAGPAEAEVRRSIAAAGLESYARLLGVTPNPFPYYREADVFCLPSRTEGSPNVLIEALACGTPVISTDCLSGPREILADGDFGRLVPVGDPVAFADAITAVRHDPTATGEKTAAGREAVRRNYAAETVVRRWEELAFGVIERRRCRTPPRG